MTFIASTTSLRAMTLEEYKEMKRRLIMSDYSITRDYEKATHFNSGVHEVVIFKDFKQEVSTNGRT